MGIKDETKIASKKKALQTHIYNIKLLQIQTVCISHTQNHVQQYGTSASLSINEKF